TLASLKVDFEASVRAEKSLEASLTKQSTLARGLAENMAQYNLLRREVDTSRDLYSSLLGRLRETQVSAALLTSNISVADPAELRSSACWRAVRPWRPVHAPPPPSRWCLTPSCRRSSRRRSATCAPPFCTRRPSGRRRR